MDRELDNQPEAFDAFREILVENPKHSEAALEMEQLARDLMRQEKHSDLRAQIYQTLQGIYEGNDAWEDLIRLKGIQLSDPSETDGQGFNYRLVAEILRDRLDRKEEALQNLSAAFRLDFEDGQLLSDIEQLSEELTSTENKVAFARQAFNDAVTFYNTYKQTFPPVFFAGMFGHSQDAMLLEFDSAAIAEAPKVSF